MRIYILVFVAVAGCTPIPQSSTISDGNPKTLRLTDYAYGFEIRTIQLYPPFGPRQNEFNPAVTPLGQQNLKLEFDDLTGQLGSYYARIIHCNQDWTKSDLLDLDYLAQYNEFPINQYEYSVDTHILYIHYWFQLPAVKLPGNYVLAVYRGSDRNDLILTKRFMVYDNRVTLQSEGNLLGPGRLADLNQQINFTVNYKDIDILNPMQDVNVSIRQNQRWDNMATGIKPSFVRENVKELEYRFFDPEKMFKGGNEFRFFDLRSINYPGRNVDSVDKSSKPYTAYILKDKSRAGESYAQYNDIDGHFAIENLDYSDPSTTNYLNVVFTLVSPQLANAEVYVTGAFNYWNYNDLNRMSYDETSGAYHCNVLLKQGWYDYAYHVKSTTLSPLYFEGSHFETENSYEIFVYYRPFQPRADLLIGYVQLLTNER